MYPQNFSWSDDIYLCVDGEKLDLHNDYDFFDLSYNVQVRFVMLQWRRGVGEWVDRNLPDEICLSIFGVYHFRFEPRDVEIPFTEDDCLASFGYDSDEEWADGQFWTDGPADPNWRWSFLFQSGAEVVVGGERAVVDLQLSRHVGRSFPA